MTLDEIVLGVIVGTLLFAVVGICLGLFDDPNIKL